LAGQDGRSAGAGGWGPSPVECRPGPATACDRANLLRAIVKGDSFNSALRPFLAEYFSYAHFVVNDDLSDALVASEKPQGVVEEMVERCLTRERKNPPEIAVASAP
jgi:hypothetical protein